MSSVRGVSHQLCRGAVRLQPHLGRRTDSPNWLGDVDRQPHSVGGTATAPNMGCCDRHDFLRGDLQSVLQVASMPGVGPVIGPAGRPVVRPIVGPWSVRVPAAGLEDPRLASVQVQIGIEVYLALATAHHVVHEFLP